MRIPDHENSGHPIKMWYHAGPYLTRRPFAAICNYAKHRTLFKPVYNVGDQISPIIVSKISGRPAKYVHPRTQSKLIAVGSVLAGAKNNDTIWGAGLKHAEQAAAMVDRQRLRILAVRGPRTAEALRKCGIESPEVYGDPALLLSTLYPSAKSPDFLVGFIPHLIHISELASNPRYQKDGLRIIRPDSHWEDFIRSICSCCVVFSTSLHGVIFSESYGIPAVLVRHGKHLANSTFKFEDYYQSTGRNFSFVDSDFVRDNNNEFLVEYAQAQPRPTIDLGKLIRAFPFKIADENAIALSKA